MNISYLITCSNETDTLKNLLCRIRDFRGEEDEVVILQDEEHCKQGNETYEIIVNNILMFIPDHVKYLTHPLNKNYSEHKNWGASQCKHDWIFQIDGDECPTETLLLNIKDIIELNPTIEAFWIPRINDFKGVTLNHANKWGWRLSMSPTYNRPLVNWPDPQCRLFRNIPDRIKWFGRLHERIVGNTNYVYLPADEDLALYHDKTIERQVETNLRYNTVFTEDENKGFKLPS